MTTEPLTPPERGSRVLAEAMGYPPLTDGLVSDLAALYSWIAGMAITGEQMRGLAERLVEAWKRSDGASIANALDADQRSRGYREAIALAPGVADRLHQDAQNWLWDTEFSLQNLAFGAWAMEVSPRRSSTGSDSHDDYIGLANASLLDHMSRMRSLHNDWT